MEKIDCKQCGSKRVKMNKQNNLYCMDCASIAVVNHRRKLKKKAIMYLGGKCVICGYNKCEAALDFHHISPDEKDFVIFKNGVVRSWAKILNEIKKCELLCSNCHREKHWLIKKELDLFSEINN